MKQSVNLNYEPLSNPAFHGVIHEIPVAIQGGARPPSYKLVISPLTIDISPINHSYWS